MTSEGDARSDRPRFALTMTVRNNAATIGRSLESLRPEIDKDGELAVVDAASADGTVAEIERFRSGFDRVRYLSQPCNRGQGRNLAVRLTTAPVVATQLDADNVYTPGVVRDALRAAGTTDRDPAIIVVGRDDANPSSTRFFVWPRAVLERVGGFPETQHAEELGLVLRAFRSGVRFERRLVPTVAEDLHAREATHGAYAKPWRRGRTTIRAARKFALLGFSYGEFVRYLTMTRRSTPRYLAGVALAALGYTIFVASGRSDSFLRGSTGETAEDIAAVLANPDWPRRR